MVIGKIKKDLFFLRSLLCQWGKHCSEEGLLAVACLVPAVLWAWAGSGPADMDLSM